MVLLAVPICALGVLAAPAGAALPTHPELPSLALNGFQRACGLAVDSAGNRYVSDFTSHEVKVYAPTGTPITSFTPSANAAGPCALAVDSSGDVYVNGGSGFSADVAKYNPSSFPPSASTTYSPDTSVNGTGVLVPEEANGVAVDPATQDVYVGFFGHISSYQPDGTLISETIGEAAHGGAAWFVSVAVRGSTGKIYAYDRQSAKIYVLSSDGSKVLAEIDGSTTQAGHFEEFAFRGLALDQSDGHVYVAEAGEAANSHVVDEFDSGGELVSEMPTPPTLEETNPTAVAVDNSGGANAGDVFVSAGRNPSSVVAFGPLTYAEFFQLEVTKKGAGQGTVTSFPAGINCGSTCKVKFQEGTEVTLTATAAAGSRFGGWQGCNTVTGNECTVTMSAKRKVSAKFNAKPAIESENVRPRDTSALLEAAINPNGEETSYQFEYLSEDAYQANGESFTGPEEALLVPASPEAIGSGDGGVPVNTQIEGLKPDTTYRFRAVATNQLGTSQGATKAFTTYLPPNVFQPCSNDAYRIGTGAELPDCRAYEQASPIDKNGGNVTGKASIVRASASGDKVTFQASAPIPGGEGSEEFDPIYLASRGAGGWSTQGLMPPRSEGQENTLVFWMPDLDHTFGWIRRFGIPNETALLDRNTDDRSLTAVVPHNPNLRRPKITGTSQDASIVFFENGGTEEGEPLTGNAADKGKPNLYVWDRETGTVRLAGVFNDGKAPPNGSFGGSYYWDEANLSFGGADLKYYTADQHAVAADGSSVYFTAGKTAQLYLRLNPTQPQSPLDSEGECTDPALACTIHVSASHKHNGTGFEGNDSAGSHPAVFMGASADGSIAFFTSSEMLTNKANTGPEQPPAQIGRAKIGASEAEEVKPGFLPKHAVGVTVSPDGQYIYWANPVGGTIGRAKLNGDGAPTQIDDEFIAPGPTEFETHPKSEPGVLTSAPAAPRYVAVGPCAGGGECVYWTNTGPLGAFGGPEETVEGAGTIGRANLNGSERPTEVDPEFITGAFNPQGVAVNSEHIYWANSANSNHPLRYGIGRAALGGESVEQQFVAPGPNDQPVALALSSTHIYFGTTQERIYAVALGDGALYAVAGGIGSAAGLAFDGTYVYWGAGAEGIARVRDSGEGHFVFCPSSRDCEVEFEYLKPEGSVAGLAFDGSRLYWTVNGEAPSNPGSDLYRFDASSGKLIDLAPDPSAENGAEVQGILGTSEDGSYLYFVANGALAAGASPGTCQHLGGIPLNVRGECNLYLEHEGQIGFIARLDATEATQAGTAFANWEGTEQRGGGCCTLKLSRVSPDGRTLLFTAAQKLTAYENGETPEIYLYRVGDPTIVCVSCNPTGLPPVGEPSFGESYPEVPNLSPAAIMSRNLSADGKRVFFESPDPLVLEDTNGEEGCPIGQGSRACNDVYEWEAKGAGSCDSEAQNGGCLYLISSGKSSEPSHLIDASTSGDDVFFFTRSQLAGQDADSFIDVYDARVGGGLASQTEPPPPVICEGEACRHGASTSPQAGSPATPLFSGPGNPKPRHKKAKPRKHRHKHAHQRHKRHAKNNGRAKR